MSYISFISFIFVASFSHAQNISNLCGESGQNQISFSNSVEKRPSQELIVITWNAFKYSNTLFFKDFKRLSETADIFLVQEAMHSVDLEKAFAQNINFDFSFHKSFCMPGKRATGVMNSARFQLLNNVTLVSPDVEPLALTPKVTAYSQIYFNGQLVHVFNTHALNFNIGIPFERQMFAIAKEISKISGPVIWAGDFNTWNGPRKNYMEKITTALKLKHLKPAKDPRNLVLDHIYIKGFSFGESEVLIENSSDHYPVKAVLKLK